MTDHASIIKFGGREYDLDATDGRRGLVNLRAVILLSLEDARAAVNSDSIPYPNVFEDLEGVSLKEFRQWQVDRLAELEADAPAALAAIEQRLKALEN